MTRDIVLKTLRDNLGQLQSRFSVRSLALYGSVARNEASEASDVDVLVEFNRPAGYFQLERLQLFIEELLGCHVDLNTAAGLRDTIRRQVTGEAIRVS